jgi:hypothetical protein
MAAIAPERDPMLARYAIGIAFLCHHAAAVPQAARLPGIMHFSRPRRRTRSRMIHPDAQTRTVS